MRWVVIKSKKGIFASKSSLFEMCYCSGLCFCRCFAFFSGGSARSYVLYFTNYRSGRTYYSFLAFATGGHFFFVISLPLLKFHVSGRLIEQTQLHATEQVFQVQYAFERQDSTNSVGGLSTFLQPAERFLRVDVNRSRYGQRVVSTDFLNEFTITGRAGISHYDKVKGLFLAPCLCNLILTGINKSNYFLRVVKKIVSIGAANV